MREVCASSHGAIRVPHDCSRHHAALARAPSWDAQSYAARGIAPRIAPTFPSEDLLTGSYARTATARGAKSQRCVAPNFCWCIRVATCLGHVGVEWRQNLLRASPKRSSLVNEPPSVTPLAAQIADVTAATAAPEPPKTRTQSRGMRRRLRLVFEGGRLLMASDVGRSGAVEVTPLETSQCAIAR